LTKNANGGRVGGKKSLLPLPSGEKNPIEADKRKPWLSKLPAIYVNTNPKDYRRKPPSSRTVTFATTGTPQPKASQGKGRRHDLAQGRPHSRAPTQTPTHLQQRRKDRKAGDSGRLVRCMFI
ncbi:hypothetical protein LEMLEM_LOCUS16119, partial [Lemmus lemmus]